jgi:hypothetical protein
MDAHPIQGIGWRAPEHATWLARDCPRDPPRVSPLPAGRDEATREATVAR